MNNVDRGVYESALQMHFPAFIHRAFRTLCPATPYLQNWHIEAIAWHLQQVATGNIRRLIITLPPRHLKSLCASVAFPAWVLGHDPTARIVCASYSADLAAKHALDCRAVMNASWYRELFPGTRISPHRDQECDFMMTQKGYRFATSVGATLTGRGGNFILVDDPLKPEDALSESKRTAANEWFRRTLYSRQDDKRSGAIVIVMQRLHVDDLVGRLLTEGAEPWVHLMLPAITPHDRRVQIGPDRFHVWPANTALHPERESLEILETTRRAMGSLNFGAQYQQEPMVPEGGIVRWEWFPRYDELPGMEPGDEIIQSWDVAFKTGDENDFSVCSTWLRKADGRHFLRSVDRLRLLFPELLRKVVELAVRDAANCVVIEACGAGTVLYDALVDLDPKELPELSQYKPETDKITRLAAVSALIERGEIHLPKEAPWLEDLRRELMQFPRGRHDDQVDSVSQYLNWCEYQRCHRPRFLGWI